MNMKTKPDLQNQSSNTSGQSPVSNNDPNLSPFQHLVNSINWVKKNNASNSKSKEKYIGICLYSQVMPISSFKKIYKQATSFYRSVVQINGKTIEAKADASIIKSHCYIPEVSGILPFPDYKIYTDFMKLYSQTDEPIQKEGETEKAYGKRYEEYYQALPKKLESMYKPVSKEFEKIIMHPVFYKYSESETLPDPFQFVEVAYTGDFDSLHAGILEKSFSSFYTR